MTRIPVKGVAVTRSVVSDKDGKYVTFDSKGAVVARPPTVLNSIPVSKHCIGLGEAKEDQKTGNTKLYSESRYRDEEQGWDLDHEPVNAQGHRRRVRPEEDPGPDPERDPLRVRSRKGEADRARVRADQPPQAEFAPILEKLRMKYPKF